MDFGNILMWTKRKKTKRKTTNGDYSPCTKIFTYTAVLPVHRVVHTVNNFLVPAKKWVTTI